MNEKMILWFLYKANQYQLSEESMSLWLDLFSLIQKTEADNVLSARL